MLLVATILIAVPLAVLALVGLVYLAAPQHLSYHRTVMEALGEEALAFEFRKLSGVCLMGVAVIVMAVMYDRPGEESLRNLLDSDASLPFIFFSIIVIVITSRPIVPSSALRARKHAGWAIHAFCAMETMILLTGYRAGIYLAGGLASVLLGYVTLGIRALGQKTGAKTPWPLLAALCAPLIIGTTLAFLA